MLKAVAPMISAQSTAMAAEKKILWVLVSFFSFSRLIRRSSASLS